MSGFLAKAKALATQRQIRLRGVANYLKPLWLSAKPIIVPASLILVRIAVWTGRLPLILIRAFHWSVGRMISAVLLVFAVLYLCDLLFLHSVRDVAYRALDPRSTICREQFADGWDILAVPTKNNKTNDEWAVIDEVGPQWRDKLACSIQHHVVRGNPDKEEPSLSYYLGFLEFQEDGKPYALRKKCEANDASCLNHGDERVQSQLDTVISHLNTKERDQKADFVLVFVHGWRHDASIGDENVQNLRIYAAHAARFIADRAKTNSNFANVRVTAIYVGWRGARTDETWLARNIPFVGKALGQTSAILTLFDRKPVSEGIAPSVLAGLRSIEQALGIVNKYNKKTGIPEANENKNRMLVLGHSLGGNLLITALGDNALKKITHHKHGQYIQPLLGDLVVLVNPAAEATKWTALQRAVWLKLCNKANERCVARDENADADGFFHPAQRPILVSVTAARNWPPGGMRVLDGCDQATQAAKSGPGEKLAQAPLTAANKKIEPIKIAQDTASQRNNEYKSAKILAGVEYDWATYEMFPAFKGDFRPLADRLVRWGTKSDPHNECEKPAELTLLGRAAMRVSDAIRLFPFMQTNPEHTHTIGHLDPPRHLQSTDKKHIVSPKPFGTTHELLGSENPQQFSRRNQAKIAVGNRLPELPLGYTEVTSNLAACADSRNWLTLARQKKVRGTGWDSDDLGRNYADLARKSKVPENFPALRFVHGFTRGGIAAPTLAADPFWNVRAFDTALARHDGYMLSSFICAIHQLVLDEVTRLK